MLFYAESSNYVAFSLFQREFVRIWPGRKCRIGRNFAKTDKNQKLLPDVIKKCISNKYNLQPAQNSDCG